MQITYNQAREGRLLQGKKIFINLSSGFEDLKNEGIELQVIRTHRSLDQPVYPSSLALANAASASILWSPFSGGDTPSAGTGC
ncbi:MAG: hypothetical protein WB392_13115 [Methanotrichaceae archaeon]